METIKSLKAAVHDDAKLEVGGKEYTLVLDFNALAKAGDELKRDLTDLAQWQGLSAMQLTVVCWAALDRYHPDVTLREVRQWLGPAQQGDLFALLIETCWPGIVEKLNKIAEEAKKPGGAGPNLPLEAAAS